MADCRHKVYCRAGFDRRGWLAGSWCVAGVARRDVDANGNGHADEDEAMHEHEHEHVLEPGHVRGLELGPVLVPGREHGHENGNETGGDVDEQKQDAALNGAKGGEDEVDGNAYADAGYDAGTDAEKPTLDDADDKEMLLLTMVPQQWREHGSPVVRQMACQGRGLKVFAEQWMGRLEPWMPMGYQEQWRQSERTAEYRWATTMTEAKRETSLALVHDAMKDEPTKTRREWGASGR